MTTLILAVLAIIFAVLAGIFAHQWFHTFLREYGLTLHILAKGYKMPTNKEVKMYSKVMLNDKKRMLLLCIESLKDDMKYRLKKRM